jgi:hypothetical protein
VGLKQNGAVTFALYKVGGVSAREIYTFTKIAKHLLGDLQRIVMMSDKNTLGQFFKGRYSIH